MKILELTKVNKFFGGVHAVSDLDFDIQQGKIMALIGPNGAGKTTIFNLITGVFKPTSGRVIFKGEDITGLKPHVTASKGISRTFQLSLNLFEEFTVLESVLTAFHLKSTAGFWRALLNTSYSRTEEENFVQEALELLRYTGLEHVKDQVAKSLPYGYRSLLGITLALCTGPELLLLDEPIGGMTPMEATAVVSTIKRMRDERGITIFVIEHNMRMVMNLCDPIVALNFGKMIAAGPPKEISRNPSVIQAYLGSEEGDEQRSA